MNSITAQKAEILAPAGSFECMKAAFLAGADAVYAGGAMFGARASAVNFSGEELLDAIDYAHLHGKKFYLTINTLLKEQELEQDLYPYLLPAYEHGLDAVIVQDLGVLKFIREYFPSLPVHAQHPDECDRTIFWQGIKTAWSYKDCNGEGTFPGGNQQDLPGNRTGN